MDSRAAFHLFVRNGSADDAENFRARHAEFVRRTFSGIDINYARQQFAVGKLQNQLRSATRSRLGHFGIGGSVEARDRLAMQFETTRGSMNGDSFEPGNFNQYIFR